MISKNDIYFLVDTSDIYYLLIVEFLVGKHTTKFKPIITCQAKIGSRVKYVIPLKLQIHHFRFILYMAGDRLKLLEGV